MSSKPISKFRVYDLNCVTKHDLLDALKRSEKVWNDPTQPYHAHLNEPILTFSDLLIIIYDNRLTPHSLVKYRKSLAAWRATWNRPNIWCATSKPADIKVSPMEVLECALLDLLEGYNGEYPTATELRLELIKFHLNRYV